MVADRLAEQLFDQRGVRFAAARLHHLAFEKLQRVFFSFADLVDRLRVRGDDLVDEAPDLRRIGDLREPFAFNYFSRKDLAFPYAWEKLLREP